MLQKIEKMDRPVVHDLIKYWLDETAHLDDVEMIAKHWAFKEIVKEGIPIRRILLQELTDGGSPMISMLLCNIPGSPYPFFSLVCKDQLAAQWLAWGEKYQQFVHAPQPRLGF
ncbi:MAG TPA: hypothetical protein VHZ04_03695 [Candidatus Paceibacterota bacterium]|jgi:hypothetical protein|nr:hypothetical protein [Candidatus Paceibacterota bacterium]